MDLTTTERRQPTTWNARPAPCDYTKPYATQPSSDWKCRGQPKHGHHTPGQHKNMNPKFKTKNAQHENCQMNAPNGHPARISDGPSAYVTTLRLLGLAAAGTALLGAGRLLLGTAALGAAALASRQRTTSNGSHKTEPNMHRNNTQKCEKCTIEHTTC